MARQEARGLTPSLLILVVEDEVFISQMVRDALSDGGFESQAIGSGEEAIALLQANHGTYRALITDINLQGEATGWTVARHAREIDPGMPIVYMTGASEEQWPVHGVPGSVLLQKPFAPAQIVTAISQLLNQAPAAGLGAGNQAPPS
jgi:DNA-binding response OmpR family regulator